MRYIIYFSDALTGGRQLVKNFKEAKNCKIFKIRSNEKQNLISKSFDILRGYFYSIKLIFSLSSNDKVLLEGYYPSLLTFFKPFSKGKIITRIGRVYTIADILKWTPLHILADSVVAPSESSCKIYRNTFINKKISIIPNPIKIKKVKDSIKIYDFIIIGRLIESKKILDSIRYALSQASGRKILVVGDGKSIYAKKVLSLIEKHNINYLNMSNEISLLISQSKYLVNFANKEGFSFISFEASYLDVPTISLVSESAQNEYIKKGLIIGSILDTNFKKIFENKLLKKYSNEEVYRKYFS